MLLRTQTWSTEQFLISPTSTTISTPSLLVLISFSLGISMCPVSPAVLCLSSPLLSLSVSPSRSPVPGPWRCVDFSGGPSVCCQHLSKMLQLSCYIPAAALFIYVLSTLDLVFCFLSPSISLSCLSLILVLYLFLLKGSFSLPHCLPGVSGSWFRTL